MAYITTNDGAKIHYESAGSGIPLVMLHGYGSSARAFRRNIPALSQRYQVITVDLRGHGESENVSYGYHMERLAKDVEELLEQLDLQDVVLLGWSMGCSVIWGYWDLFRAKRLSKLILFDEAPLNLIQEDNPYGFVDYDGLKKLAAEIEHNRDSMGEKLYDGCLWSQAAKDAYLEDLKLEGDKLPAAEGALLLLHHCYTDWRDIIPTINIPTLVIGSTKLGMVKPQANQWNHNHIPNSQLVFVQGAHGSFLEFPEEFDQIVMDFIG